MNSTYLLIAILFPIVFSGLIPLLCRKRQKNIYIVVGIISVITSIITWVLILTCKEDTLTILTLTDKLVWELRFDGLGKLFAGIIATLWPITILYASEYMKHEERQLQFFTFFTITYGITLGIAMSANFFTMYTFYELLTLSTVPLVMQPMTHKALRATRMYLVYSIGGAALGFATMMYVLTLSNGDFVLGGILNNLTTSNDNAMLIFYVVGFFGFGVKSAMFPVHKWLPKASVAPTPVTALLHAVAVVKSGAFAIIRLTFYTFGTTLLYGTWAQTVVMILSIITILYGSSVALKEQHLKRRLAYSTVANISYILLGVSMMTNEGLIGALLHMIFHAEIKILAFFVAGAILHTNKREYTWELNGIGKKMPITFACFVVASLALTGIPPFSGFVSKWYLLTAAANSHNVLAYIGAVALLISALLTAIYMLTVVTKAYFPDKNAIQDLDNVKEADIKMLIPMCILALGVLFTGVFATQIVESVMSVVYAIGG
ncbi:MAG: proton-conducting membrane transporter [Clostridia bacterium]|nr:proton-conducting membrane transporter [Clostridia bacterium]